MKYGIIWVVIAALAAAQPSTAQTIEEARHAAADYSRAFLARDVAKVVAMTDPVIVEKFGGTDRAYREMHRLYESEVQNGLFPMDESIDQIRSYVDGDRTIFFAKTIRRIESFPLPIRDIALYVLSTPDQGKTWRVIDLACISANWVRVLAPHFDDQKMIDAMLERDTDSSDDRRSVQSSTRVDSGEDRPER